MCSDDQHGSSCFETDTAFDTDDGVAHVHVTSDTVCSSDFLYFLNSLDLVVEHFAIDSIQFTFLEFQFQLFAACLGYLFQISTFRQSLCRIQDFTSTDGSTPDTYVIRIFQFGEVGFESMFLQVIDFIVTAQCHVAGKCDDFHSGSHNQESHVETHLVISCTG